MNPLIQATPDPIYEVCILFIFGCGIIHLIVSFAMMISVNRRVPRGERIPWGNPHPFIYGDGKKFNIAQKYADLEPGSMLPAISSITLVGAIMGFVVLIATGILNR